MDLNNKVVVVTGAGRGLGRGIAEALASRGARIACVDLNEDDLRDTVARCERAGGEARPDEEAAGGFEGHDARSPQADVAAMWIAARISA